MAGETVPSPLKEPNLMVSSEWGGGERRGAGEGASHATGSPGSGDHDVTSWASWIHWRETHSVRIFQSLLMMAIEILEGRRGRAEVEGRPSWMAMERANSGRVKMEFVVKFHMCRTCVMPHLLRHQRSVRGLKRVGGG